MISPELLRFFFVLFVVFVVVICKIAEIAYRRGRQHVLREHFSFTIRPDHSVRHRL